MSTTGISVFIEGLSEKGEALARHQDMLYFIDGPLPGEEVTIIPGEAFVKGSKRAPAQVLETIKSHPQRCTPFCRHYAKCGGCALQQASITLQHALKAKAIDEALKAAGADVNRQEAIVAAPAGEVTRFKSIRRFALHEGQIVSGFYQKRSHELTAVYDCPLEPSWMGAAAYDLCSTAQHVRLLPYDEESGQGCLRALLLREGDPGERLLLLVAAHELPPIFIRALQELCTLHGISAGFVGINDQLGNQVLPQSVEHIFGRECIVKTFGDCRFEAGPLSFLQVNYPVTEALYQRAVAHCGLGARALDLCCGAGTMTLQLARHFKEVVGVEIVPSAIEAAKHNAELNGIANVSFYCRDMSAFLNGEKLQFNALIADPARVGLGEANCRIIGRLQGPLKAAFIFCSLKALKRDLKVLLTSGFRLDAVQGYDMFLHSMHIETLVLLSKD